LRWMCCDRIRRSAGRRSRTAAQSAATNPRSNHSQSTQGNSMNAPQNSAGDDRASGLSGSNSAAWRGRFPYNEIISLLDVNRPFNLAESTSQDLTLGEVLDLAGLERIRDLKLGYGKSAGDVALREAIAEAC